MDRTEIVGNSMLMILAGYENTGNTMSFLAYNLAYHPEVQTKLQEEVDEMIKKNVCFATISIGSGDVLVLSKMFHFSIMCLHQ